MNLRIRFACAFLNRQFTDNHQRQVDFRNVAGNIKTMLHQGANRAIVVLVKVVMMVLGNRKQARHHKNNDYGL